MKCRLGYEENEEGVKAKTKSINEGGEVVAGRTSDKWGQASPRLMNISLKTNTP
jgi:hypothetical protein